MTILDRLNSPKCDFTQNRSGGKIIKVTQCQALTSHFESFWSIVPRYNGTYCISLTLYITFTENKVIESITTSNSGEERFTTSPLPPVGIPDQQWPFSDNMSITVTSNARVTVRKVSTKPALNDFASWPAEFTKELVLRNYLFPGIFSCFV